MPLHFAREGVQEACARMRRQPGPQGRRCVGRRDGGIHIRLAPLRGTREHCLRCGIDRLEILPFGGSHPAAVDEVPEASVVMLLEPLERGRVAFRRRPVLHRLEQPGDGCHYTIGCRWAAA